jgi:glycosyltransferase involved in cell wall biosynthesis
LKTIKKNFISVICCAHNEDDYIGKSVPNILKALESVSGEFLFVADRCTDNTVDILREYGVSIIEKKTKIWKNSYAEALQIGYLKAQGNYIAIVDADVMIPTKLFNYLLPIVHGKTASVASEVITYPDTFWNRLLFAWEKTQNMAPLGKKPKGAVRLIAKRALDEVGGFSDVTTPDTYLDIKLSEKGYKSRRFPSVVAYHLRHTSPKQIFDRQLISGRARYELGESLKRTLVHSLFRIRPFVLEGWLQQRFMRQYQYNRNTPNVPPSPLIESEC